MNQDHGFHSCNTNVNEMVTIHRNQRYVPALFLFHPCCRKHKIYSHWLSNDNQWYGCWASSLWIWTHLEQYKVDGVTDKRWSLLSSTERANVCSLSVCGNCWTRSQPYRPLAADCRPPLPHNEQNQKLLAKAHQNLLNPCSPIVRPRDCDVNWTSRGEPPIVSCTLYEKDRETLRAQKDGWFHFVVGALTFWQ